MVVSVGTELHRLHNQVLAAGLKLVNSDFAFEIEGFEDMWLQVKQCPEPQYSPGGEIEIAGPAGSAHWQAQQAKAHQQGALSMFETEAGKSSALLLEVLAAGKGGAHFNAKIYTGTSPENYKFYKPIYDCFIVFDAADRDWENRAQPLVFTGTLFYHYFGEKIKAA